MASLFEQEILQVLNTSQLDGGRVVEIDPPKTPTGDAQLVYQLGSVRFRFDRYRGDLTLVLGPVADPDNHYLLKDIGIALGWWTVDAAAKRKQPMALSATVQLIAKALAQVDDLFGRTEPDTLKQRLNAIGLARAKIEFGP